MTDTHRSIGERIEQGIRDRRTEETAEAERRAAAKPRIVVGDSTVHEGLPKPLPIPLAENDWGVD